MSSGLNIKNKHDALMILLNNIMQMYNYTLIGLNEDITFDKENYNNIPNDWNNSNDSWSFKYSDPEDAIVIVKGVRLGGKMLFCLMIMGDSQTHNMDVDVDMFVQNEDFGNLDNVFKNVEMLNDMVYNSLLRRVTQFKEQNQTADEERDQRQKTNERISSPVERHDPLRIPGTGNSPLRIPGNERNPFYVGDPLDIANYDDRDRDSDRINPFEIGSGDLYPQFGNIPGGNPGTHMGPNHPGFGPGVTDPYAQDPYGLFQPQRGGNVGRVPGARFDPYGPPGTNFGRPNNDHFPPPGFDGGFY
jgi:proteasome inhibitor subunit 1 (PI31)